MSNVAETASALPAATGNKSRPQDDLLYDMDLPLQKIFYPLGFAVEILTNDPAVLKAADESFGHLSGCRANTALQLRVGVSSGGPSSLQVPTRRECDHLYSLVADPHNQALLDLNTGTNFAWLSQSAVADRLYLRTNFLEKIVYLLLGASCVTDIHAACVSHLGKGILLCGDSGAGKSTLAYACARAGWTYTSDDTSYLINNSTPPRVTGHAHRVRFRPAAKLLFPELADLQVTPRIEGKPSIEVPVAELSLGNTAVEVSVNAIVYLHRVSGATGSITALPPGTATTRMRHDLFSAGAVRARHEEHLSAFADVPTYTLEYCALKDGIAQLDQLVLAL